MSENTEMQIGEHDVIGKKVGAMTAILAVLLSVFTICAHRAHTESIEFQNETNDKWSHYQAKRIRDSQLEMNGDLLKVLAVTNPSSKQLISVYAKKHQEYAKEIEEIKKEADLSAANDVLVQKKALYFDFAEGLLEISLVLSSLYFISRKKLFPILGIVFGMFGTIIGAMGLFLA